MCCDCWKADYQTGGAADWDSRSFRYMTEIDDIAQGSSGAARSRSETDAAGPLTHTDIRSIIIGVLVAMFLAALDQTIVATAMPTIGRDLGDFEHLSWVVT